MILRKETETYIIIILGVLNMALLIGMNDTP